MLGKRNFMNSFLQKENYPEASYKTLDNYSLTREKERVNKFIQNEPLFENYSSCSNFNTINIDTIVEKHRNLSSNKEKESFSNTNNKIFKDILTINANTGSFLRQDTSPEMKLKTSEQNQVDSMMEKLGFSSNKTDLLKLNKCGGGINKKIKLINSPNFKKSSGKTEPPKNKVELLPFSKSQAGRNEYKKKKINQDSYIHLQGILGLNYHIFAVLDGHGRDGHLISDFVKNFLIQYYSNPENYYQAEKPHNELLNATKTFLVEEEIYNKLIENNHEFIKNSFYLAEKQLKTTDYEINLSGTTCNFVIMINDIILCANAGDSRAILYKETILESGNVKPEIVPLSEDHKPEDIDEQARILKCGGMVSKFEGKIFYKFFR
jgi:serine/threonine protein phosphatase PrpC